MDQQSDSLAVGLSLSLKGCATLTKSATLSGLTFCSSKTKSLNLMVPEVLPTLGC